LVAKPAAIGKTEVAIREGSESKSRSVQSEAARESRLGVLSLLLSMGGSLDGEGCYWLGPMTAGIGWPRDFSYSVR